MTQQSKSTLQSNINTQLADNTAGDISAADVRNNLINMTDSLVFNTGDNIVEGNLTVLGGISGSLIGTSSFAVSTSFANQALSASYAVSASYEINYETSSSYADFAVSASYSITSSFATSASYLTIQNLPAVFSGSIFTSSALIALENLTIYADNANNYGGSWTNGSDQGTGFDPWQFTVGVSTGTFLGNPSNDGMGTTGIGTNAFALYATSFDYVSVSRSFISGLQVGDVFTFYWAMNFDANGGSKGFDLKSSGTTIFNVNNTTGANITTTNGIADTGYGTVPMLVTLTRISNSQYTFSMTSRSGGATYTTTINSALSINNITFYCGNQNDGAIQRNIYFNNFNIISSATLSKTTVNDLRGALNITSSFPFTGSAQITGSLEITGSLNIIGNINVNGNITATNFTGSLLGTASYAVQALNSSFATTASYAVSSSYSLSSSYSITSSYALTAQTLLGSVESASYAATASLLLGSIESASYAATASLLLGSIESASYAATTSIATTSSYALTAVSSSYSLSSSFAITASYTINSSYSLSSSLAQTASYYKIPVVAYSWTSGYFNLTNGIDNTVRYDTQVFNSSPEIYELSGSGTIDARIYLKQAGVYEFVSQVHLYDQSDNIDVYIKLLSGSATGTMGLVSLFNDEKSVESSTDKTFNGTIMVDVTTPQYYSVAINPSVNSPYPSSEFNTPTRIFIKKLA